MSNIIDSIRLSGVTYTIQGTGGGGIPESAFTAYTAATDARIAEDEEVTAAALNELNEAISGVSGNNVVELTQAEYDALVTGGTVNPTAFYIITDATAGDLTQYWTSAQTQSAITSAVSTKQDALVSGTNIKTINNESILGSGNIDIQGGGVNVVQTTGTSTTDVMSQDAVTSSLGNLSRISKNNDDGITRWYDVRKHNGTFDFPIYNFSINGKLPLSQQTRNSDYSNIFNFHLVETSAITTSVTSSSTDAQVPSAKAVYDAIQEGGGSITVDTALDSGSTNPVENRVIYNKFDEVEEVTAAGLNELNEAISGKQATLVSGTNIKTINNESILGSGNIEIQGGGSSYTAGDGIDITNDVISVTGKVDTSTYNIYTAATDTTIGGKASQSDLETVSGNVNTISGQVSTNTSNISTVSASTESNTTALASKADTSAVTAIQDSLSGYVTTDTEQTISGRKIFTYSASSGKAIEFKQTDNTAKVGFRIINSAATNNEVASFEFRPNTFTIDNVQHPLMYFGHYRNTNTANAGVPQTVIGFRQYDQKKAAAYHYLIPLPEKAKTPFNLTTSFKDYYAPMGFKNGSTMITADNTGVVDLSSELDGLKLKKLTQAEYDTLATKDPSTLYIIVN